MCPSPAPNRWSVRPRERLDFDDGSRVEMVIWRVPTPVPGCNHPYKYRLFYGRPGKRIVGYDNERPKGDHRHRDGQEEPYEFKDVGTLIRDSSRVPRVERFKSPTT
ncbi:MAG: toxin-antitoxin system TumE family protein [Steroidobacteraceae bacterium]